MKRLFYPFLIISAVLCLFSACQRSEVSTTEPSPEITSAVHVSPEPPIELVAAEATAEPTPLPTAAPTPEPVPTLTPEPTPEPTPVPPLYGVVIGIDPGHQLIYNPAQEPVAPGEKKTKQKTAGGTIGTKSRIHEYEVNLAVGLKLRDILTAAGATVFMTHDTLDINLSNAERAEFFNQHNVDLAIRLHCNNNSSKKVSGAFMLVPKEHRTDWYDKNVSAATCIIISYCELTGIKMLGKNGLTYRGDQTGFNWCTRPICTIEMGHMTNPEEDLRITDSDFQSIMARGIANGIIQYFTGSSPEGIPEEATVSPVPSV